MTMDLGRPLHVFDADKLSGDTLTMSLSRSGERFLALDGKDYGLEDGMVVIRDAAGLQGLGGVMGGEESGCTDGTTNVFLEAALFDPIRVAETGRKLNIQSDARFRFERGVDPDSVRWGVEVAARLIQELCGGEVSEVVSAGTIPEDSRTTPPAPELFAGPGRGDAWPSGGGGDSNTVGLRHQGRGRSPHCHHSKLAAGRGGRALPAGGGVAHSRAGQCARRVLGSGLRPATPGHHVPAAAGGDCEKVAGFARHDGNRDLFLHGGGRRRPVRRRAGETAPCQSHLHRFGGDAPVHSGQSGPGRRPQTPDGARPMWPCLKWVRCSMT